MNFESFYFYTNQRALKRYLINYKIEPSAYYNDQNITLSDRGQNFLLFWKGRISVETILKNGEPDGGDIPVVLEVFLPTGTVADAYSENGTIGSAKISDCKDAYAVKIVSPVSFFNVIGIFYVDKQIRFLQGDTTLVIPEQLISGEPYTAPSAIDASVVDNVIRAITKASDCILENVDEDDESELSADILSGSADETDEEKSIKDKSVKEDKLIAAYAMFVQGRTPFDGRLTSRLYSVLNASGAAFDRFVRDNFYKDVPQDVVYGNVTNISVIENDYISALKGISCDGVFASAVSVILNHTYSVDDKECFLNGFLSGIRDAAIKNEISEVFADRRARTRLTSLQKTNPELIPIYFLYTFFDYKLDRFCDNITEFGLDKNAGIAYVTLSLWALLHGMGDIFREYKNIELLYAVTRNAIGGTIIDYEHFVEANKIASKDGCVIFDSISCAYTNIKIEYAYCVGTHEKNIRELVAALKEELKDVFDFRYTRLRNAVSSREDEISDRDFMLNKETIHKKYLQLRKEKSQTVKKSKKRSQMQISFFDDKGEI